MTPAIFVVVATLLGSASWEPRCAWSSNGNYKDQVWLDTPNGTYPTTVKYLRNGNIGYGAGTAVYTGTVDDPDVDVDENGNTVIVWDASGVVSLVVIDSNRHTYQTVNVSRYSNGNATGCCPRVSISRSGG